MSPRLVRIASTGIAASSVLFGCGDKDDKPAAVTPFDAAASCKAVASHIQAANCPNADPPADFEKKCAAEFPAMFERCPNEARSFVECSLAHPIICDAKGEPAANLEECGTAIVNLATCLAKSEGTSTSAASSEVDELI